AQSVHARYPTIPIIYYSRCGMNLYLNMLKAMEEECPNMPIGMGVWQGENMASLKDYTNIPLQGNLDPTLLVTGGKAMGDAAVTICNSMQGHPFIFNLGHGIIKETPVDHVAQLIKIVRAHTY
ncbi:MAG: uroporphyrinogen decarboxylase, partial [Alphaproteobacteria bacterium]|nr:uroporphyrinogen decarboxylase [Alphaproteobacteria bacterium]